MRNKPSPHQGRRREPQPAPSQPASCRGALCPNPGLSYCAQPWSPPGGRGGPTRSQDCASKGSQGCPRGPGRQEPGRGCVPKRLAAPPQAQRPLLWAPSPPPLPPPGPLPAHPSAPPATPILLPSSPRTHIYRQTSGGQRPRPAPTRKSRLPPTPPPQELGSQPGLEQGWVLGWATGDEPWEPPGLIRPSVRWGGNGSGARHWGHGRDRDRQGLCAQPACPGGTVPSPPR